MKNAPSTVVVNPAFDPRVCEINPGTSFWLSITDATGIVATIANRLLVTSNFIDEMRSGKLWFRNPTEQDHARTVPEIDTLVYGGRVGHAGGLWVHPRARKSGLPWLLARLIRAYSI